MKLLSSASNRHTLIVGTGLDAGWSQHHSRGTDWGIYLPLQTESLLSAGALQWRNRFAWIPNRITDRPIDSTLSSDLAYPLGE